MVDVTTSPEPTLEGAAPQTDGLSKALADLDAIVQALLSAVPQAKPWQRQLRGHLCQLGREVQILRMTVSMGRDGAEVRQAASACNATLRAANSFVAAGRADMGTKAAVRLAFELGLKAGRLIGP